MNKKVLVIVSCFIMFSAFAQNVFFNPVTTITSRNIKKNTFSISRGPMGNINSTFLISSLNYGLFSRLEIGTAPLFYLSPEHKYNYIFKTNFYRGEYFDWSVAFSENRFRVKLQNEHSVLKMSSGQLAFNFHPPNQPWAIGGSYTNVCGYIDSANKLVFIYSYKCTEEYGFDIQYSLNDNKWVTLGTGKMRDGGLAPYELAHRGIGLAYTQFFEKKFFSRPSLGVYRHNDKNVFLISSTIYEER
jgi:hypothetical protein